MTSFHDYFSSLSGRDVTVAGLGVSNLPLVGLLLDHGARVTGCDRRERSALEEADELERRGVTLRLGKGYLDGPLGELVFRSPGLLPSDEKLRAAAAAGSRITSEMELFLQLCPAKTVGITGSDGKTTTTTVISKILEAAGKRVFLGGNIGWPLLPKIPEMRKGDFAVVELSSFQLMEIGLSPDVAVVTNVSPNHLDKHSGMAEYVGAKRGVFCHQGENGVLAANYDNEITRRFLSEAPGAAVPFSSRKELENGVCLRGGVITAFGEPVLDAGEILLPGLFNIENYMAACAAVLPFAGKAAVGNVARSFAGVEHRNEFVREACGVRYYNSSIDSSPSRLLAALSLYNAPLVLIAGGCDKNVPFDAVGEPVARKARAVILSGPTAQSLAAAVTSAPSYDKKRTEILFSSGMEESVALAQKVAKPGDVVLLSPACTAFDAYKNFEYRGRHFKRLVNEME